jgi:hypothetical protein
MKINGVCSIANFEVIDIVANSELYPTFLGLDWALNYQEIINVNKREMIFEG